MLILQQDDRHRELNNEEQQPCHNQSPTTSITRLVNSPVQGHICMPRLDDRLPRPRPPSSPEIDVAFGVKPQGTQ